jgi:hypothetical protein
MTYKRNRISCILQYCQSLCIHNGCPLFTSRSMCRSLWADISLMCSIFKLKKRNLFRFNLVTNNIMGNIDMVGSRRYLFWIVCNVEGGHIVINHNSSGN